MRRVTLTYSTAGPLAVMPETQQNRQTSFIFSKLNIMKTTIAFLIISISLLLSCKPKVPSDFNTIYVNKKIKEFPDILDLSTPIKSCVSINYIMAHGKNNLWRKISSSNSQLFLPDTSAIDSNVSEDRKNRILNTTIRQAITFKDSISCVISETRDSDYSIRWLFFENGKWLNAGEDGRKSIEDARQLIEKGVDKNIKDLRKIHAFSVVPNDTLAFINYLKNYAREPKEFVLDKLSKYKLVMYGEIHRRKASWDFLQEVVNEKKFIDETAVIFLELGSDKQKDIDKFLANSFVDKELLLNVFRDYMLVGWNDKGKFDFINRIWQINRNLPLDKKIKIVAVDTPRPPDSYKSKEAMRANAAKYDRDEFMADTILNYLKSINDKRNALFIVGTGHVCEGSNSAGSILSKKMPQATYAIFQHSPRVDNTMPIDERIRYGIFDYAFYKFGDKPVAFEIKNSPFGKEPFDGLYYDGNGTYQDNYDGYIFLGSLDNEPNGEILFDLYSDNFIKELDRRYQILGSSLKDEWELPETSKKAIIEKLMSDNSGTRWGKIIKPLKNGLTIK